jgi:hypothetical protein
MGFLSRKPKLVPPPPGASPAEHLAFARAALAQTGTYHDEHGRRRRVPAEMRAELEAQLARVQESASRQ